MPTDVKYSQEELDYLKKIKEEVDLRVYKRIEVQMKLGYSLIDEKALAKTCTDQVFREIEQPQAKIQEFGKKFVEQLKADDPSLYDKLAEKMGALEKKFQQVKDFHDMVETGKEMTLDPEILTNVYEIGARYYTDRNFEKAHLYLIWLSIFDAKNPKVWFLKGVVEQILNTYPEALISYNQVLEVEPDFLYVYPQIINCLVLMGDMENAKTVYEQFTKEVDPQVYSVDQDFTNNMEALKAIFSPT